MAIDDAADSDSGQFDDANDGTSDSEARRPAAVGEYTWAEYLDEYGPPGAADDLYRGLRPAPGTDRWEDDDAPTKPAGADWDRIPLDPVSFLGFHPDDIDSRVGLAGDNAETLQELFEAFCDPETTPVVKDEYLWEHYKREYYYEDDGSRPRDADGEIERFDPVDALGHDPDAIENTISHLSDRADELEELVEKRTVNTRGDFDEDEFFSTDAGTTTVVNRYDLEKAVPMPKKTHFEEVERYWVNEPYAFVIIFHSTKENEDKYYVVQPYMNRLERELEEYLTGKLRTAIKYADDDVVGGDGHRRRVIEEQTFELLERYDLYSRKETEPFANALADRLGIAGDDEGVAGKLVRLLGYRPAERESAGLDGISARPEPAVLADDDADLTEYQVDKLLYFLTRDFIGYERIDGIKHDINVEDISCDGYNSPVFVYHGDYEQIITNVYHEETELDDFVVKLAQRSGKGISKRRPQVDATLPDGSRAQLTLGKEVSDHGTNYTIRQFKEVPFTPIDLICWHTFSLDEMAFLWLCIENHKSLIFAGGTASGKTTSLNAVSLFIPSNTKIVSIEDTREVELPQRNWIASVTRPSFSDDDKGDVDEFDLLEAALRQRPDYIVMGEIRGEEGRTLFQVMSTGHTTYTTFHADSVGEVLKRFTTEPINVSKTMFSALDLVSIQTSTRVQGNKVRRNKSLTEINHYDAENDEINVQDVYQWQAEDDEFLLMGDSNTLDEIKFDRGWSEETLRSEMFQRQVVLAYLIDCGLNTYTQVAATFQAFINDPDTILTLMADDQLERSLEDLREMESVLIDIDPEMEEMVPRPDPDAETLAEAREILQRAEEELFEQYRGEPVGSVADVLSDVEPAADVTATSSTPTSDDPALDESSDDPALNEKAETDKSDVSALTEGEPDEADESNNFRDASEAAAGEEEDAGEGDATSDSGDDDSAVGRHNDTASEVPVDSDNVESDNSTDMYGGDSVVDETSFARGMDLSDNGPSVADDEADPMAFGDEPMFIGSDPSERIPSSDSHPNDTFEQTSEESVRGEDADSTDDRDDSDESDKPADAKAESELDDDWNFGQTSSDDEVADEGDE
ncbi:ATPase, T2SS/T4P/T4SS family [Haloprofundus salilacus]|uniref:ATPase, T2SS/T4P/T4SS family n=1 Tax=Haloprofundus salilacus TaxID=2876190 RepID=UPI001CCE3004|nr:ATPase, T2SS/T4P/T4SS family [Haloprofundus salilacus]